MSLDDVPVSDNEGPIAAEIAFMELKGKIVKAMFGFMDKYASGKSELYPDSVKILINVLTECLNEAQYQLPDYHPFTAKQIDHICYQIGDWYMMMKPLLEGQHNLGYMKEKLKTMIIGE